MIWKCKACEREIENIEGVHFSFCPKCGAKIEMDSVFNDPKAMQQEGASESISNAEARKLPHSDAIFCPQCNTILEPTASFCWSCGIDLDTSTVKKQKLADPWSRWAARLIDLNLEFMLVNIDNVRKIAHILKNRT